MFTVGGELSYAALPLDKNALARESSAISSSTVTMVSWPCAVLLAFVLFDCGALVRASPRQRRHVDDAGSIDSDYFGQISIHSKKKTTDEGEIETASAGV